MIKYYLSLIKDYLNYILWEIQGEPIPPQSVFKRKRIIYYAKKFLCQVFVETGTFHGKTILFVQRHFKHMYSIEICKPLYEDSLKRTKSVKNVSLYLGESEDILMNLRNKINDRALFWLDAHYSGAGTGTAETECPILAELSAINKYKRNDNVILIDDAREYKGINDYPSLHLVLKKLYEINPKYNIEIKNDCIIATP
jgi:hypothetical protein